MIVFFGLAMSLWALLLHVDGLSAIKGKNFCLVATSANSSHVRPTSDVALNLGTKIMGRIKQIFYPLSVVTWSLVSSSIDVVGWGYPLLSLTEY